MSPIWEVGLALRFGRLLKVAFWASLGPDQSCVLDLRFEFVCWPRFKANLASGLENGCVLKLRFEIVRFAFWGH